MRFFLTVLTLLLPIPALAQVRPESVVVSAAELDLSKLSDKEILDLLTQLEDQRERWPRRVSVFGIPLGFGVANGVGFASLSMTNRRDRGRVGDWDASIALGIGLGNPETGIGVTPVIDITSVSPHHFGESGKVSLKFSRAVPLGQSWRGAVGLDLDNLLTWGDSQVLDRTTNLAFSGLRRADAKLPVPILLTGGYGTGVSDRGNEPGFFGGIGVGVSNSLAMGLGWFGDEAIAGANYWPGGNRNLQISVGIGDITDNVSGRRLLLAVSIAGPLWRK